MKPFSSAQLSAHNLELKTKSAAEIISWALQLGGQALLSTNFRPYEAAILHACCQQQADMPIIWCDHGYNSSATYRHANELIAKLNLNIHIYAPLQTSAYRNICMGGIPEVDSPLHAKFTEQVKLEPFARAMREHPADIWFSNLRYGQTEHRNNLDILSYDQQRQLLKVCPFFYADDAALDSYLQANQLPNEFDYYDPSKAQAHRECGLHLG